MRGPLFAVTQVKVRRALGRAWPRNLKSFEVPDGESAKSMAVVARIINAMMEAGLSRDGVVIAIGGGTVGDVAGFAASVYMRGVSLVHVPTTLLAQVDSSIGGKTGVNHASVKNLVGTFHPPSLVIADSDALKTLPNRHFGSGLYEALKYGLVADASVFEKFSECFSEVEARREPALSELIAACARTKASIVSRDERESGIRRILNFGHTIGHAIESARRYRSILHGEAVGYGMLVATRLSREMGILPPKEAERVEGAIHRISNHVRRLPRLKGLQLQTVLAAIALDKKIREGQLHFILLREVGRAEVRTDVPVALLRSVVRGVIDEHQS